MKNLNEYLKINEAIDKDEIDYGTAETAQEFYDILINNLNNQFEDDEELLKGFIVAIRDNGISLTDLKSTDNLNYLNKKLINFLDNKLKEAKKSGWWEN